MIVIPYFFHSCNCGELEIQILRFQIAVWIEERKMRLIKGHYTIPRGTITLLKYSTVTFKFVNIVLS